MARKKRKIKSLKDLEFSQPRLEVSSQTKRGVLIVLLFAFAILAILSLFDLAGTLGVYLNTALKTLFGVNRWYVPLIILLIGYFLMRPVKYGFKLSNFIGLLLFILGFTAFIHTIFHQNDLVGAAQAGLGGGFSGIILAWPLLRFTGFWATLVLTGSVSIIGFLLLFESYLINLLEQHRDGKEEEEVAEIDSQSLLGRLKGVLSRDQAGDGQEYEASEEEIYENEEPIFYQKSVDAEVSKVDDNEEDEEVIADEETEDEKSLGSEVRKFKNVKVDMPLTLLDGKTSTPKGGDLKANKEIIRRTLENFGVPAEMGEARVGPTVTQYTLKPAEGVRLSKITGLSDNLALALAAHPIRIEAPIPGLSLVGIEVPNQATAIVPLKEILDSLEFSERKSNLAIALGKDVMGKPWLCGLDKMPHLLIAGATGSGKSVAINTLILSLLFQNGPGELKFIMVDPKRVELPLYNGIPHLLTPVITDTRKTINSLRWAIKEMENRFDTLSTTHHRNIASYNEKREDKMPYIVIVIDELADLMATAGPEVEAAIVRLSQMSRAVGIHLVLATQRPSVDVITGLIKANVTTRIAFSVASLVDSRTILDMSGAEKLLGRGDMLYMSAEISKPKRLQGAFASDDEIKRIINHLKQQADPEYIEEIVERQSSPMGEFTSDDDDSESDPLMEEAKEVVFRAKKASASLLQRRLRIGYARAARILDLMEAKGMIGPADGAKPRDILISDRDDARMSHTSSRAETDYASSGEADDSEAEDDLTEAEDEIDVDNNRDAEVDKKTNEGDGEDRETGQR